MKLSHVCAALLTAGLLYSASSFAVPVVLDFEGAGNQAALQNFYNGGTDSQGHSGTNYGVTFGGSTLALIDADAGGDGNFANEPSPSTIFFFLTGASAVMNYAAGFDTGFSFYYTSSTRATVTVYDDIDGGGNVLATIDLIAQNTGNNCTGDPSGTFCNWDAIGVAFAGIAKSVDFGGTQNQTGYDNVTFGAATPCGPNGCSEVPEPASLALLGLGLAGLGFGRRKRA
ncbi:MAG: PEP-CTERM sorting domain-containing protein [Candidatus Accumulibacter sp.]|nr:PEP-CTERM sorting domain-containing protein [Accumulibacter sp.]